MKRLGSAAAVVALTLSACGSVGEGGSTPVRQEQTAGSLTGEWQWVRSCDAVVRAFRRADLADLTIGWLVDARYFPHEDQIDRGQICDGADETRYVYFFEESGRWGMLDDDDALVDDKAFSVVDEYTIAFDEVRIDYRINDDGMLRFDVLIPQPCDTTCREEHAWAIATFASGSFRRVA
jgi:hypothetical protein